MKRLLTMRAFDVSPRAPTSETNAERMRPCKARAYAEPSRRTRRGATLTLMAQVVLAFPDVMHTADGTAYTVTACGLERPDGTWEGWLEFTPDDTSPVLRSGRETTQPNLADLRYWATGITPVYLEGALDRALKAASPVIPQSSVNDTPVPSSTVHEVTVDEATAHPVLDPFSVYAKGSDLLRQQLHALSERHLTVILRAYRLTDPLVETNFGLLNKEELVALIMEGVRARGGD